MFASLLAFFQRSLWGCFWRHVVAFVPPCLEIAECLTECCPLVLLRTHKSFKALFVLFPIDIPFSSHNTALCSSLSVQPSQYIIQWTFAWWSFAWWTFAWRCFYWKVTHSLTFNISTELWQASKILGSHGNQNWSWNVVEFVFVVTRLIWHKLICQLSKWILSLRPT